jgi:hypothetical protein
MLLTSAPLQQQALPWLCENSGAPLTCLMLLISDGIKAQQSLQNQALQ